MKKLLISSIIVFMFCSYSYAFDLTNGLIAYYPFNGNAADESITGNNGVVYGAVLSKDRYGKANSAYKFDGIDDYIEINNIPCNTGPMTFNFWIYLESNADMGILSQDRGTEKTHFSFEFSYSEFMGKLTNALWCKYRNEDMKFEPGYTGWEEKLNRWYMITVAVKVLEEYNYMSVNIYQNGMSKMNVEDGKTLSSDIGTGFLNIGRFSDGNGYFNGKIDDIRIYNRKLSNAEIEALYYENADNIIRGDFNGNDKLDLGDCIGILQTVSGVNQ